MGVILYTREKTKTDVCMRKFNIYFYACRHLVDMPSLDKRSIGNDEFSRLWNPLGRSLSIYWAFMTLRQESTINLPFIYIVFIYFTFLFTSHFLFLWWEHISFCSQKIVLTMPLKYENSWKPSNQLLEWSN